MLTASGPWRTTGEWWTETRWVRDAWDIDLSDGGVESHALGEADAQSTLAQIALGYTRIVSPIDGTLGVRAVHERAEGGPRRGVEAGSLTLHPAGLPHGPHPGRYEESVGQRRTEEVAVMLDCHRPLSVTREATSVEDEGYDTSFIA